MPGRKVGRDSLYEFGEVLRRHPESAGIGEQQVAGRGDRHRGACGSPIPDRDSDQHERHAAGNRKEQDLRPLREPQIDRRQRARNGGHDGGGEQTEEHCGRDSAAESHARAGGQRAKVTLPRPSALLGDADSKLIERHADDRERDKGQRRRVGSLGARAGERQIEEHVKHRREDDGRNDVARPAQQIEELHLDVRAYESEGAHAAPPVSERKASSSEGLVISKFAKTAPDATSSRT